MVSVYFDVVIKTQSFQMTKAPKGSVKNSDHKSPWHSARYSELRSVGTDKVWNVA